MRRNILNKILILFIILFFIILSNVAFAAGSFTVSKSSTTITEGKKDTFSINGSNATGKVEITSSDTSVATVSSSSEWIENNSTTITITAKKAGTSTITVTGTVADSEGEEATITKTIKVTVKAKETTSTTTDTNKDNTATTNKDTSANTNTNITPTQPKEKSNNAFLKTLGVRITDSLASELGVKTDEYDFSGFSKTKTSYNVTVPKNVDSLKIVATPADSNAKVSISGNTGFEVGTNNKITIKVTAEDGKTTKTYTIKVTKLAEEEEKPGNLIEDEEGLYLTSLSIKGVEISPEFAKDTYSYSARLVDSSLNEVEVEAKANIESAKIDISGNTGLIEGENTINILLTLEDSTLQTVYQIVVTKEAVTVTTTDTAENNSTSTTDLIGTIKNYAIIAIGVIVLIIIAVIVLIILLRRENKKLYEEDEDDELEEYNTYKNDENEFRNNDIEKDNFIESLYKQRTGNIEDLSEDEKETLQEIAKQTEEIFTNKIEGQSVEFDSKEMYDENPLEVRKRRRGKGKHSI